MQRKKLGRAVLLPLVTLPVMMFSGTTAPARAADDLVVRYDQSQLLWMPRAVSEIIIGNPSIADVTVQSGNMLVITGKTFGITNIIALDADKNVIQDQRVVVERDERGIGPRIQQIVLQVTGKKLINQLPHQSPAITMREADMCISKRVFWIHCSVFLEIIIIR
mgnify:CR=1 FL=1